MNAAAIGSHFVTPHIGLQQNLRVARCNRELVKKNKKTRDVLLLRFYKLVYLSTFSRKRDRDLYVVKISNI